VPQFLLLDMEKGPDPTLGGRDPAPSLMHLRQSVVQQPVADWKGATLETPGN